MPGCLDYCLRGNVEKELKPFSSLRGSSLVTSSLGAPAPFFMNSQKPESRNAKEDGWSRKKKTFQGRTLGTKKETIPDPDTDTDTDWEQIKKGFPIRS